MCNLFILKETNIMRKQFKSIAAAILAVLMLMSISMTAVAAEQVPVVSEAEVSEASARGVVQNFGPKNLMLYANAPVFDDLYIPSSARTVQHKLVSSSVQSVVFRFQNLSTGETRSFTALSNNGWLSDTYNTSFPAGHYKMWVVYASASGSYDVAINFLS